MKNITLTLTLEELTLLTSLSADQLFRKEFIDPKIAGYRSDPDELKLGKALVGRLRLLMDDGSAKKLQSPKINGANH